MKKKPESVEDLDLLKRLKAYATGDASWRSEEVSTRLKNECRRLHVAIVDIIDEVLARYLDRVTAKEMDVFTLHDSDHGLKVAHLMWHVLSEERRERLTPPEIALLVLAAHVHDLGMGLTEQERNDRLDPESDLWARLDIDEDTRVRYEDLEAELARSDLGRKERIRVERRLEQVRSALLCEDTRERHATRERFGELLGLLIQLHERDNTLPDVRKALQFNGTAVSLESVLIDVCMSHNNHAEQLFGLDPENPSQELFPRSLQTGECEIDVRLIAVVLRIADILDFDRERTPRSLFYYLLPTGLTAGEDVSVREWKKHLAIEHWSVEQDAIVFRATCEDHIVHHAIVEFCKLIEEEIRASKLVLGSEGSLIALPDKVETQIHTKGYTYMPYRFQLEGDRIHELMMGRHLYPQPLDAVRELIQNSVDACQVQDRIHKTENLSLDENEPRVLVQYLEPPEGWPRLVVRDRGTGMDKRVLEQYFLRIGRSYYSSHDFRMLRARLLQNLGPDAEVTPVSEFGIGILSCFLLADRVIVETQRESRFGSDHRRRTITIDGPSHLMRLHEREDPGGTAGTIVTLELRRGSTQVGGGPPTWDEVRDYVRQTCVALSYPVHMEHVSTDGEKTREILEPLKLTVPIPESLVENAIEIDVADTDLGLEGKIVLLGRDSSEEYHPTASESGLLGDPRLGEGGRGCVVRGGFRVAAVDGLPKRTDSYLDGAGALVWTLPQSRRRRRYCRVNLARTALVESEAARETVLRSWLTYLVDHHSDLPPGLLHGLQFDERFEQDELFGYSWFRAMDPWELYLLVREGWIDGLAVYLAGGGPLGRADRAKAQDLVRSWEEGHCDEIWSFRRIVGNSVCGNLLHMLLDRAGGRALMLANTRAAAWSARKTNGRDDLKRTLQRGWGDSFVLVPHREFAAYVPRHKELLYMSSFGAFNEDFEQDVCKHFDASERRQLRDALERYKMEGDQLYDLSEKKKEILRSAGRVLGDSLVASRLERTWTLSEVAEAVLDRA